jgi:Domain of unknown function (DUF4136)
MKYLQLYGKKARTAILRGVSAIAVLLLLNFPASAKVNIDFDPNLDFSKFKTYAYIGGVDRLVMLQVNPELINIRVHRAVARELEKKGLREVQPTENPDLVVRYWAASESQVNVSTMGNWGPYGPYIGYYWGFMYDSVSATSTREGTLIIDVINSKGKDLAWRLYLTRKITNVDKVWKQADEEITKAFENYPPSAKAIEEKKREREKEKDKIKEP